MEKARLKVVTDGSVGDLPMAIRSSELRPLDHPAGHSGQPLPVPPAVLRVARRRGGAQDLIPGQGGPPQGPGPRPRSQPSATPTSTPCSRAWPAPFDENTGQALE